MILASVLIAASAEAAITLVQHVGKDAGTTTSSTLAFPANNTAGNWLAVAIRAGKPGQVFTVTDTRGNTYRRALQYNETLDTVTMGLFYAENIAGGPNTVTVSDTINGGTLRFAILEYSGLATSSSLDGAPTVAEGTGASLSSTPTTTTANGDLVLGVLSTADPATFTAGSGFTLEEQVPAAPGAKLAVEDQKQTAAGPIAATATLASGQAWTAAVAAFRSAAAGPPPVVADLTLSKTHVGSFTPGKVGTYTLIASNNGIGPTVGTVTVSDTLPAGLTATLIVGTGWQCTLAQRSCSRSDALPAGSSYPRITLFVSVSASAPASVTNVATVAGGGETNTANDTASDVTAIGSSSASQVGQWSAVRNWPIVAVHAQLLPTGDVLAWSDFSDNGGAQIWRPVTNTFTPKSFSPVNLFCAGHAFLADGRLLVSGGIVGSQDDLGPRQSETFDSASESWSVGPLMTMGRYYPTMTTLPDGRILVQGGTTTCTTCIADLPEIYDPVTNSWTSMAPSARMPFKYYPHTYVLPDGRILAAAQDDSAVITQALDLNTQTWTTIDPRIIDGHSSVMYQPGKLMKAGKATADNEGLPAVATTYTLDMTQPSPTWQATASMAFPRSYLNLTVLPDGQVLATGGGTTTDKKNFATAVYEAELWSPTSKTWTTMSRSQTPRLYHSTALLLPDATVLVAGGGRTGCTHPCAVPSLGDQQNAEIFSPPYLFKGARPVISSAPAVLQYSTDFSVVTPDAARVASVALIALGAVTHSFNENQRFVPLAFEQASGSLNVHPPANGNTAPPGPYMVFLVDTNGVPSIAAMVRLQAPTGAPPSADLTLSKTHIGSFTPGQVGATYTLTATNSGTGSTAGTVTVSDTLPAGLTATAFGGSGWQCTLTPLVCNRSTALAPGASYPAITLTVTVSASAPASVTNVATVSGGGETNTANNSVSDVTAIGVLSAPDLTLTKTHSGSFIPGQVGATYTLTATNNGAGPTAGTVTVSDALPAGLTATAIGGSGWQCTLTPLACNRSDVLAKLTSYPAITLTVTVSPSAPASVTNVATVGGGGETNTSNDSVSDVTAIGPAGSAITLVQHVGKDAGTTTSSTLAFPANNTAGNWLAVAIRGGRQGQVFTVTDTRGNTYRRALQYNETLDTVTSGLFYAENIAGGPNTVTVSDTITGGTLRFSIMEYSGVATVNSLDGAPAVAEGTGGSLSSPAKTTTANGDLILGLFSTADGATYTAGGGFTLEEQVPAAPGAKLAVEDRKQTAAGSIAATATISSAQAWMAAVAAFFGPPPSNPPKLIINTPAEASNVIGTTVNVRYSWIGDQTEVNHVHFQMDANPVVMDLSLDGVYAFNGMHVGSHTLNGWLVRADHSAIAWSDATPVHFVETVDPADAVPPTVSLTGPSGGSTLSGIVTVTANAGDNVGVYGVQFKLDGAVLGGEDPLAPYSTDWDTATAVNGTHTLTAIARDAAGNETSATPVTVTVSNVGPNDPSVIGQWAGPYNWPLISIHTTLMPNGKVLLFDNQTTSPGVQVWDPVTDTLTSRPYNASNLFCAGHTLLPDGRVLVVGGHVNSYIGIPDATIFDSATETWSAAAPMAYARWYPNATSLPDGRVLVMSGAIDCPTCFDPSGSHAGIALIPEVYNPRNNTWTKLTSASLSLPLYPHMHVLPDGRVVAVASQEDMIVSRALDINAQTWTVMDPVARDGGSSVMYRPGKILKTGMGRNPDYSPIASSTTAFVMDTNLPTPTWRAIAPMSFPRTQHNLTMLPDGNVFAVGGSRNSDVFDPASTVKTAELWSPATETWRTLATMQEPRHYHSTSLLLPDGRVLVSGGGRFGPNFPTAEIYSPPYLFKGARPVITSTPPVIQYNAHFTVVTGDAPRIARVALLRLGSVTHGFDENQRYVELAFTPVAGGLDVTGSTSANIVLPGHYMLFLVDTNGVPSVASIVRFPAPWEDGIPPTAPTNLAATTAPGRVDLTWSAATDNSGVALYNIHRGTLPGVTPSPANRVGQSATTSFRDTGFASGAYYYVVTAQDAGGNVGPASNETGLVAQADVTAPVVAVTAPTSGAMLSGLVTIAANATDDIGVAGVQFLLDGAALQAEDTTAPYAVDWNTNLAANGAHTLSARARDARGNTTDAANVGVTASNTTIAGLVAAYSFGEGTGGSVADSTGNGNTGTITNATWTTSGKFGNALVFNGTNAKVTIPDASALDLTTAMTLEAWVYPTTTPTNWSTILHKEIDRYYIAAGSNTGAPAVGGTFTSGNTNLYGAAPMTANVWTHVAATYDGTTLILYLNGNPVSSKAVAGSLTVSGSPVSIGGTAAYGEFFTGRIDEVRIYNRALTQAQVQQDMAQPVP